MTPHSFPQRTSLIAGDYCLDAFGGAVDTVRRLTKPPADAMKTKLTSILVISLLAALFSGCATTHPRYGSSEFNLLTAVRVEQGTYSKVGPLTIGVKASELYAETGDRGGRIRLFSGLITFSGD